MSAPAGPFPGQHGEGLLHLRAAGSRPCIFCNAGTAAGRPVFINNESLPPIGSLRSPLPPMGEAYMRGEQYTAVAPPPGELSATQTEGEVPVLSLCSRYQVPASCALIFSFQHLWHMAT